MAYCDYDRSYHRSVVIVQATVQRTHVTVLRQQSVKGFYCLMHTRLLFMTTHSRTLSCKEIFGVNLRYAKIQAL